MRPIDTAVHGHRGTARVDRTGARAATIAVVLCLALTVVTAVLPAARAGAGRTAPPGLEVSGNHLTGLDGGAAVRLLGVDRSGAEYECTYGANRTVFDGPITRASIRAIKAWHTDVVRIPLNEDCWLGISGAVRHLSGPTYRNAVERLVGNVRAAGMDVILDLHWAAPGSVLATEQWPMADADHAPTFWRSVASTFGSDRSVLFDLYNEPFISSWPCWRDGCTTTFTDSAGATVTYRTAGMQQLVDAVRSTGARNPIMLGGLANASDESGWLRYEPRDPLHQLVASFHTYNFSACHTVLCWDATIAPLARRVPVVTGELGQSGCLDGYVDTYMRWADAHGVSYLGWAWDATDSGWSCSAGPALIVDYDGQPTAYGIGFRDHLAALAAGH
jgi:hypothetical protein